MKFFHLSDLHIGLKLLNRDLLEDQKYILNQIADQAKKEKPDAVVIAGDIYDKTVPSAEAVGVFDRFVLSLRKEVPDAVIMMISGNHDSAPRVDLYRQILEKQNIYMIGMPPQKPEERIQKVTLRDEWGNVHFYLLPFVRPSMIRSITGTDENGSNLTYEEAVKRLLEREQIDQTERNILVSHQFYLPAGKTAEQIDRMDSEIQMVGNLDQISAGVLEPFDYSALGHIHKPMKVGTENRRYCGTPIACSVSEAGQQKEILMVELREKGNCRITEIPLVPLHPVKVIKGTLEEVEKQRCQDYVSVILSDQVDLDVCDMQDRLYEAFPNLLEIRREYRRQADYSTEEIQQENMDPFSLCCMFLKDMEEDEKEILQDVIRVVQEELL